MLLLTGASWLTVFPRVRMGCAWDPGVRRALDFAPPGSISRVSDGTPIIAVSHRRTCRHAAAAEDGRQAAVVSGASYPSPPLASRPLPSGSEYPERGQGDGEDDNFLRGGNFRGGREGISREEADKPTQGDAHPRRSSQGQPGAGSREADQPLQGDGHPRHSSQGQGLRVEPHHGGAASSRVGTPDSGGMPGPSGTTAGKSHISPRDDRDGSPPPPPRLLRSPPAAAPPPLPPLPAVRRPDPSGTAVASRGARQSTAQQVRPPSLREQERGVEARHPPLREQERFIHPAPRPQAPPSPPPLRVPLRPTFSASDKAYLKPEQRTELARLLRTGKRGGSNRVDVHR